MRIQKQKLPETFKKLIRNIFIQVLIVSAVIMIFIPDQFDKYRLDLKSKHIVRGSIKSPKRALVHSKDLNGDGKDELVAPNDFQTRQSIHVFDENLKRLGQWNFEGDYLKNTGMIEFSDIDKDGLKEVWGFTYSNDSLFLNAIEPFDEKPFSINKRFILRFSRKYYSKLDIKLWNLDFVDLENDGNQEFVFFVRAGYNLVPRKIFVYHPLEDSLLSRSLEGINSGRVARFVDIDNDTCKEIIIDSHSSANYPDSLPVKYRDDKAWLAVFNHDLSMLFPPKSYFSEYSHVRSINIEKNDRYYIGTLAHSYQPNNDSAILQIIDKMGNVVTSKKMKHSIGENTLLFSSLKKEKREYICLFTRKGDFFVFNRHLDIVFQKEYETDLGLATNHSFNYSYKADLENDGKIEFLLTDYLNKEVLVLSDDLSHLTSYELKDDKLVFLLPFHIQDNKPQLWAIGEKYIYKLSYGFNPLYYWQYAIYLGIFGGVLLFIWGIRKLYEQQVREKYELRNQVERLQLRTLQNKMDPHFVLNTTNTIGSVILKGDSKKAYDSLVRFSKLMRTMLYTSEDILQPLNEEISFVREYLHFQQMRFGEKLNYRMEISEDIDLHMKIPKMCIFIHVENAVKHGIAPKDEKGEVSIRIELIDKYLKISIFDNGIGLKASQSVDTGGNGYGLKILSEIYSIINRHNHIKVEEKIEDDIDSQGQLIGTKVSVLIPKDLHTNLSSLT